MAYRKYLTCVVISIAVAACRPAADFQPHDLATGQMTMYDLAPTGANVVAFPTAEGFGAGATGGRGGKVIYVTTLAKNGAGSLQEALDAAGPRTILFKVSGMIEGVPILSHGDVTIAGQSSPGGIAMRGLLIQGDIVCEEPSAPACPNPTVFPENFIVRHLRLRPGDVGDPDGAGDGLRLHHAINGIIDHVSVGNAMDEAIQVSFASEVTIQYTMLAETIGEHYEFGGMLLNYSDPARGFPLTRLSIHHNLWNRIFGRMPEVSRENVPDDKAMELELSNNVLYDHQRPIYVAAHNPMTGALLDYRLNVVGNFSVQNAARPQCYGLVAIEGGPDPTKPSFQSMTTVFFDGNRMNRTGRTDYELIYNDNDFCDAESLDGLPYSNTVAGRPVGARDTRHDFPSIAYTESGAPLLALLADRVGAFPRDPMDKRLLVNPQMGTFSIAPIDQNPANDLDEQPFGDTPPAAPDDTDGDGMPDTWETAAGLNPTDASDGNATTLSTTRLGVSGYTNLEVYLHELSEQRIAAD